MSTFERIEVLMWVQRWVQTSQGLRECKIESMSLFATPRSSRICLLHHTPSMEDTVEWFIGVSRAQGLTIPFYKQVLKYSKEPLIN